MKKIMVGLILALTLFLSACGSDSGKTQPREGQTKKSTERTAPAKAAPDEDIAAAAKKEFKKLYDGLKFERIETKVDPHEADSYGDDVSTVILTAENALIRYEGRFECVFSYDKTDKEWSKDSCREQDAEFFLQDPESYPEDMLQTAGEAIGFIYSDFELEKASFDPGQCMIIFEGKAVKRDGYYVSDDQLSVLYQTDDSGQMFFAGLESEEVSGSGRFDILGSWSYKDSHSHYNLTVHYFEKKQIRLEYDYDIYFVGAKGLVHESGKSDRVEDADFYTYDEDGFSIFSPGLGWLYFDKYIGFSTANESLIFSYDSGNGYEIPEKYHFADAECLLDLMPCHNNYNYLEDIHDDTDHAGVYHGTDCLGYRREDSEDPERAAQTYNLYGTYRSLSGLFFLSSYAEPGTEAIVRFYGDGKLLYEFNAKDLKAPDYTAYFSVDVEGVRELTIDLPGEFVRHMTDWMIPIYYPVINLTDLVISRSDSYECYDIPLTIEEGILSEAQIWDKAELTKAINQFSCDTGYKAFFAAIPYNKDFYRLTSTFDYELNPDMVVPFAEEYAKKLDPETVLILYFSDGVEEELENYFYIHLPGSMDEWLASDFDWAINGGAASDYMIGRITEALEHMSGMLAEEW